MKVPIEKVGPAKKGDKAAFACLYDSVAQDLYRMALYSLGNAHDAEDVVSETFIEAYKGIGGLRDEGSFKPWIMRILYIRCKRRIAQYIKDKPNTDIEEVPELADEGFDLEKTITNKTALSDALAQLTPEERTIVILSAVHGYTTKEVSQMLELPHGTVSSKLHRTYGKLRKLLETAS